MDHKSLLKTAFNNSILVIGYIVLVAWFFQLIPKFFGNLGEPTIIAPIIFLTLFVVSAAITGGLVLGKPALLYFDGAKKDSITLFLWTVGLLALFFLIAVVLFASVSSLTA